MRNSRGDFLYEITSERRDASTQLESDESDMTDPMSRTLITTVAVIELVKKKNPSSVSPKPPHTRPPLHDCIFIIKQHAWETYDERVLSETLLCIAVHPKQNNYTK